jgi:type II secretory pathway pseudopilin PulG
MNAISSAIAKDFSVRVSLVAILAAVAMLGFYAGSKKNEQDKRQIQIHNQDLQAQTESAEQTRTTCRRNTRLC